MEDKKPRPFQKIKKESTEALTMNSSSSINEKAKQLTDMKKERAVPLLVNENNEEKEVKSTSKKEAQPAQISGEKSKSIAPKGGTEDDFSEF